MRSRLPFPITTTSRTKKDRSPFHRVRAVDAERVSIFGDPGAEHWGGDQVGLGGMATFLEPAREELERVGVPGDSLGGLVLGLHGEPPGQEQRAERLS
ncbi:hypothetical protein [Nocardioides aromaticivorans]|uniref:hypothetical protein n=1 Tax=Nocardioides aromaticivorans TaxID=200618 RepID=UPI001F5D9ABC|nr:hypothetical protein [Nocardioides aromaticivorans]